MIFNNEASAAAAATESDGDDGRKEEEDSEESRVPRAKRAPNEPTNEEIRVHEITHTPYRNWCPCCVAGRGKSDPHFKTSSEEKAVAGVHVDYWFLRDNPGEESTPVLVAKDDTSKAVAAHIVFQKGNLDWVAARVVDSPTGLVILQMSV